MSAIKRRSSALSDEDFLTPADRECHERPFDIDDPTQIPDLIEAPPNTDEVPEIEFSYDTTPPGGREKGNAPHLTCVFQHSARHWKGYIVRWKSGARARLGPNCGSKHFDFTFKHAEARFTGERNRHNDLFRAMSVRRALPAAVSELRNLAKHPVIGGFDDSRQQLRNLFPEIYQALGEIARTDRILMTSRFERDRMAEDRRAETHPEGRRLSDEYRAAENKGPGVRKACAKRLRKWMDMQPPIVKVETQNIGMLSGGQFLTEPRTMAQMMLAAGDALAIIANEFAINQSDHWDLKHPFSETFRELREIIERIDAAAERFTHGRQFSARGNLERVVLWSQFEVQATGAKVATAVKSDSRHLLSLDGAHSWSFPAQLNLPPLARLEDLRAALRT